MNTLRSSTLSLSLAVIVITLGFGNPTFAAKPDKCPDHPSCKPDPSGDDPVTYKVELRGAFVVEPLSADLEGQDERLRPVADAVMTRADSTEQATWDNVFSMPQADTGDPCNLLGMPGTVDSFTAHGKNKAEHVKGWRVARPGGVYVQFPVDQLLADPGTGEIWVDVSLQLRGNCEYSGGTDPCEPFLPDPGADIGHGPGVSVIPLTTYQIHASALKGEPQFEGCHTATGDLWGENTLVITATAPP